MSESSSRRFPTLRDGEFAVLQAEGATGYVLTLTGERAIGGARPHMVFASLESAQQFAKQRIAEQPLIERWLSDHLGTKVELVRDEAALAKLAQPERHEPWWRRLFFWRGRQ